jgi:hypothetical protein
LVGELPELGSGADLKFSTTLDDRETYDDGDSLLSNTCLCLREHFCDCVIVVTVVLLIFGMICCWQLVELDATAMVFLTLACATNCIVFLAPAIAWRRLKKEEKVISQLSVHSADRAHKFDTRSWSVHSQGLQVSFI